MYDNKWLEIYGPKILEKKKENQILSKKKIKVFLHRPTFNFLLEINLFFISTKYFTHLATEGTN